MPNSLVSIAILGSGNIVGMIISAIALILFSRYMGPAEFGIFSASFAVMQIAIRIADLGTNLATERGIARVHGLDLGLSDRLMRVAIWFKLFSFLLVVGIGWVIAPWISDSLLHLYNTPLIRLSIVLSIGTIFFEYSTLVFQSTHNFALAARIMIAQAIGKLIFGLIFMYQGILHTTQALLIYGLLPGLGAALGWRKFTLTSFTLPSTWKKDLNSILSVAKWTAVAAIATTLSENIDILMVQSFMTSYDTGIWSGVGRIATFASVLGLSVGAVLNVRVAKYIDPKNLVQYLKKSWKISIMVFLGLLLALPFAGLAISLTIGSAYLAGTLPLQILILSTAVAGAAIPYIALFYLFDRPEYYAFAGIIQIGFLVVGDILFIPQYGLVGAAWVRVVVRVAVLVFTLIYAKLSFKDHFKKNSLSKS